MSKNFKYFIGLGGNLGDVEQSFQKAIKLISNYCGEVRKISNIYQSEALQIDKSEKQNDYLNCAVILDSNLDAREVLSSINKIEKELGRNRVEKWGARNIDIDILAREDLILKNKDLTIPHPEMQYRTFVLMPLIEIAPSWIHPELKKTLSQLFSELENPTTCKILKPFPRCEF